MKLDRNQLLQQIKAWFDRAVEVDDQAVVSILSAFGQALMIGQEELLATLCRPVGQQCRMIDRVRRNDLPEGKVVTQRWASMPKQVARVEMFDTVFVLFIKGQVRQLTDAEKSSPFQVIQGGAKD